jgi:hypothetical protein
MPDIARTDVSDELLKPSSFMRKLRPEIFSDTVDRPLYVLDRPTLEFQLETLTARNEHQRFEIFCRKLCERVICPSIRPQSGPEGGGDGKTDAETYPVAERISELYYFGQPGPDRENWAFAFSAMKDWKRKVVRDVEGIVATGRRYERIYFVTSQPARAKDRARIEAELLAAHNTPVSILDRAWIANEVIDNERKDIASDYLGVGQVVNDPMRLGPEDYSRRRRLDAIERSFRDSSHYDGMERQMVVEAMIAACLSRNLEAPRHETDGRHARAIRIAGRYGIERQQLEARYDALWTAFWWFDDIHVVNDGYRDVEAAALKADHARNVEFLVQLHQLLVNAVIHRMATAEACDFEGRSDRLEAVLVRMAGDVERPNHRLEARTSLVVVRTGRSVAAKKFGRLPEIWAELGSILDEAAGLAEYDADRLVRLIEAMAEQAGRDPAFRAITERLADFVAKRTSDVEGALILLRQALRLGDDGRFERIRLLGRAAMRLAKREHSEQVIEAQQHLAIAYRGADLLWAARSSCLLATAGLAAEGEERGELPVGFVPTTKMWAWIALQLRLVPELAIALPLLRGAHATLPLDEASKERVANGIQELDAAFGSNILNMDPAELASLSKLPDLLGSAGMGMARIALLYALGYEDLLREEGSIQGEDLPEDVARFMATLKAQPVSTQLVGPLILNRPNGISLETCICGLTVDIRAPGSETGIILAQAIAATFEAILATLLEEQVGAHTERFRIDIVESDDEEPQLATDPLAMRALISWPRMRAPREFARQSEHGHFLIRVAGEALAAAFVLPDLKVTLNRVFAHGEAHDRVAVVMASLTCLERITGKAVARLQDEDKRDYPPRTPPIMPRIDLPAAGDDAGTPVVKRTTDARPVVEAHRRIKVQSVIDVHSWDRAGWTGIIYASYGPDLAPVFGLHFRNRAAARRIFERWRERFGDKDEKHEISISLIRALPDHPPTHYAVQITSARPQGSDWDANSLYQIMSRVHVMEPADDRNLSRFMADHRAFGCFILAPSVTEDGEPEIMLDLAIFKRDLPVVQASDVKPGDIQAIALELVTRKDAG